MKSKNFKAVIRLVVISLGFFILFGCMATLTQKAIRVRITKNPVYVQGCKYLGVVQSSSSFGGTMAKDLALHNATASLKNKAAQLGANILLMTSLANTFWGTRMSGEAYLCGGSPIPNGTPTPTVGSGFLLTASGLVVTNYHIVEGRTSYEVVFPGGQIIKAATVRMKDTRNDIAILALKGFNLADIGAGEIPFSLANSRTIKIGQEVFTLGFPLGKVLGKSAKLSTGTISSLYGIADDPRTLQISNPIQPGNSGGPLFNENGEVVGIVVASLNAKYLYEKIGIIPQNVNFAIKVDYLNNLIDMLPEVHEIRTRKNRLFRMPLEKQVEILSPYIVKIKAK